MVNEEEEDIIETFTLLQIDTLTFSKTALLIYAQESLKAIAKAWAKEIIRLMTDKSLQPPLRESTIERRIIRAHNIKGPDYPLLETGEWMTFIEFRISQEGTRGGDTNAFLLEVGVFDDVSDIGHTDDASPSWLAIVSEYGNLRIPARHPFSTSEMRISSQIDNIIAKAWTSLSRELERGYVLERKINATIKRGTSNFTDFHLVGRIVFSGNGFKFKWDDG